MGLRTQTFRATFAENDGVPFPLWASVADMCGPTRINGSTKCTVKLWSGNAFRVVCNATDYITAGTEYSADRYFYCPANIVLVLHNIDPTKTFILSNSSSNQTGYGMVIL